MTNVFSALGVHSVDDLLRILGALSTPLIGPGLLWVGWQLRKAREAAEARRDEWQHFWAEGQRAHSEQLATQQALTRVVLEALESHGALGRTELERLLAAPMTRPGSAPATERRQAARPESGGAITPH